MPTFQQMTRRARLRANKDQGSKRFKEIVSILLKHNLREGITPEEVVSILEDLGPTFVKLGQIASSHPDVLPAEYCNALSKLQANVEPMSIEQVKEQIATQLGSPVEELFESFDEQALGSASIAQVHKAILRDEQSVVAVKVQRPGIAQTMSNDIALLERAAASLELLDVDTGQLSIDDIIGELERTCNEELDFTVEARNLERFHANNAKRDHLYSPNYYPDFSTQEILVMDYAEGPSINDEAALNKLDDDSRETLAYLIADNYMQQMMVDGFFHADPHPGNILLSANGGIEWIDFGMMGELSSRDRDILGDIITAIVRGNSYDLKRSLLKLCTVTGPIDHAALLSACDSVIDDFTKCSLESMDMGSVINGLMGQLQAQGFVIKPSIVMVGRGLATLEGTIQAVSGKLDIATVLNSYMSSGIDFDRAQQQAQRAMADVADSAKAAATLPTRAAETLDMLQRGHLNVGVNADVDQSLKDSVIKTADRATGMLMAAALFVGSCILCTTGMQPRVLEVPVIGLIGFITGFLLAIYNFWGMFKDGHRRKKR